MSQNTPIVIKIFGQSQDAGNSVSSAGDMNGDGITDFIIGAGSTSPARTNYVIYGKIAERSDIDLVNFSAAQGFKILGSSMDIYRQTVVSELGDINGDGRKDIIIAAPKASVLDKGAIGIVHVIYGASSNIIQDIDLTNLLPSQGFRILGVAAGDVTGNDIRNAGDINGDGIADIIIGASMSSPNGRQNSGISYVIYGKNSNSDNIDLAALTPTQGFKIVGGVSGDHSGCAVSGVGDINGDGIADMVTSACYASPGEKVQAGTTYAIYGQLGNRTDIDVSNMPLSQGFKISGEIGSDRSGWSVSGAGDVNHDGIKDIIIGAYTASPGGKTQAGASYVIYGQRSNSPNIDLYNLPLTKGFKILGEAAGDQSGTSVSKAGDINGDGIDDIIIGANFASPGGKQYAGASYVIYGQNNNLATIDLSTLLPTQGFKISGATGDYSGWFVSGAGDVNGDGIDDLIIGGSTSTTSVTYLVYGQRGVIPNVDLSQYQGFRTFGTSSAESLTGTLRDDVFEGKGGPDAIDGLGGTNTASYASSPAAVTVNLVTNINTGGDAVGDHLTNIQNLIGSAFNDNLTGDNNANKIQSMDGNDINEGRGGADDIDGGLGINTASYVSSSSSVTVNLATNINTGGDAAGDRLTNIQNLLGSNNADNLTGDGNNNVMEGKGGADTMDGAGGINTLSYSSSPAAVTVSLTSGKGAGGDAEGDTFTNFQNILGSAYGDYLTGDAHDNSIDGGPGTDTLVDAGGRVKFYGGADADKFVVRDFPGTVSIMDLDLILKETIDFTAFTNIHSLSALNPTNQQGDTHISLPNKEIVISGVTPSQLTDANFVFNSAPPEDAYWTPEKILTVGGAILGAVGTILAIVVRIHSCHKEKSFCFKDHMAKIAAPIAAAMADNGPVVIEMAKHAVEEALGFHDNPLVAVGVNENVGDNQL
jgi:hypothetical protein